MGLRALTKTHRVHARLVQPVQIILREVLVSNGLPLGARKPLIILKRALISYVRLFQLIKIRLLLQLLLLVMKEKHKPFLKSKGSDYIDFADDITRICPL